MRRPIRTAVVVASLLTWVPGIHGQPSSAADQIRQRIVDFDRGGPARNGMVMKDAVMWTGASSKPLTKETDKPDLVAPNRRNDVFKTTVERIEVAQSGDLAYQYSSFSLAYDDDRGHTQASGALVRIWKKDAGVWKIAVQFQRPYGDIRPLLSQSR